MMMKIGSYEVSAVETGYFKLDGGAMFGVVPKALWERTNPADEQNRIDMAMRALLIRGEGKIIIVDCGIGVKLSDKLRRIYDVEDSPINLEGSLAKEEISLNDVTHVILTHLHFDHTGGATTVRNGKAEPTFPNATYYLQKQHWELALNPTPRDKGSFMEEDFVPLEEAGQLELLDGESQLFEGVDLLVVNGHTPGQQLVRVSDGDTTLLYAADLVPTSSHILLPYIMSYDLYPVTTMEEKSQILGTALREDWILFFEHDPKVVGAKLREGANGPELGEVVSI